jgi:hypothetical protein
MEEEEEKKEEKESGSSEVVSVSLAILCESYMADPDGRGLLWRESFPRDLLQFLTIVDLPRRAKSLFIGLSYAIASDFEFKKYFVENGYIGELQQAYGRLGEGCPWLEICGLVKEIMKRPVEDEWVVPIGTLVGMISEFARIEGLERPAFQALRAFANAHGEARKIVQGTEALGIAVDKILAWQRECRLFQTSLSFVARVGGCGAVAVKVYRAVAAFIDELGTDVERIDWALSDAGRIAEESVEALEGIVETPLFEKIASFVMDEETPWMLFVQSSLFIARFVQSKSLRLVDIACRDGLFLRALRALLEVDHVWAKGMGLDAIGVLIWAGEEGAWREWRAALIADEWVGEQLEELAQREENPRMADMAGAIFRSIVPQG